MRTGHRAWLLAAIVAAGVLLNLPSLWMGFYMDDYLQQLVLRGEVVVPHMKPWSLYDFGGVSDWIGVEEALGAAPWWSAADWEARFLRPLTSVVLWLDFALFGSWAPGYHLTSLVLYAVLLLLAHRLYRALGLCRGAALGALAFFVATNGAALPVAWIANRNTLLGTLFTIAALLAVARPADAARGRRVAAALALALCACLSKESGVVAFALVALRLALHARGAADPREQRRVLLGAGLALALAVVYVCALGAAGYGTRSLFYATPWREPLRYLGHLGVLFSAGLLRLVAPVSLDLLMVEPRLTLPAALVSVPIVALLGFLVVPRVRALAPAGFLAAWVVLGFLPQGAAPPSDRLLMDSAFASAGLLALFVGAALGARGRPSSARRERVAARALIGSAGVLSALLALAQSTAISSMARDVRARVLATEVGSPELGRRAVVVLQSANGSLPFALASTWAVETSDHELRFWTLQLGRQGLAWTREDERTFVLESLDEPFLMHVFERLYLTRPEPPPVGWRSASGPFEVEVLATEAGGVRSIRVRFDRSLDDPRLRFLVDREGVLAAIPPPAIGGTTTIPLAVPADPFQL